MGLATEEITDFTLAARFAVNILVTARDGADRVAWARRIHDRSERHGGPFVAVSAQVRSGRGRGRQADDVDGWFERAAGGTLFIDRVGELCREAQARLLSRLTEQRRSPAPLPGPGGCDRVRVIAGTDRSISTDVAAGAFSDVLFYRLNVVHIDLMQDPEKTS